LSEGNPKVLLRQSPLAIVFHIKNCPRVTTVEMTPFRGPLQGGVVLILVIAFLVWLVGKELTRWLASIHAETQTEISGGARATMFATAMLIKRSVLG
jgi:hypothetical protein